MIDTDYVDDLELLSDTPTWVESLLHGLSKQHEALAFIWAQIKELINFKQRQLSPI